MIKVILADDQILIREGIKFIIEQDKDIKVVGMASNGFESLELCDSLSPDLVLMDIMMPICNGIKGTKIIKEKYEHIKIVVLTTFHDTVNVNKALKNGADGFILKDIKPNDLIMAIKGTMNGLRIVDHSVYKSAVKLISNNDKTNTSQDGDENSHLSERDIEIIRMIVIGKSNKDIAASISLSEGRVKNIVTGILKKLNVSDRIQLAIYAIKSNLV